MGEESFDRSILVEGNQGMKRWIFLKKNPSEVG
jgi:hypothetical protein